MGDKTSFCKIAGPWSITSSSSVDSLSNGQKRPAQYASDLQFTLPFAFGGLVLGPSSVEEWFVEIPVFCWDDAPVTKRFFVSYRTEDVFPVEVSTVRPNSTSTPNPSKIKDVFPFYDREVSMPRKRKLPFDARLPLQFLPYAHRVPKFFLSFFGFGKPDRKLLEHGTPATNRELAYR